MGTNIMANQVKTPIQNYFEQEMCASQNMPVYINYQMV